MQVLHAREYDGWHACPGRPALEQTLGQPEIERHPNTSQACALLLGDADSWKSEAGAPKRFAMLVRERMNAYKLSGAEEVHLYVQQRLLIEVITTERGAIGTADAVIVSNFGAHAVLEIVQYDDTLAGIQILAVAALLKFALLYVFSAVSLALFDGGGSLERVERTVDELYVYGRDVTEAGALSLSLIDPEDPSPSPRALLEHLKYGEHCNGCFVRDQCPRYVEERLAPR